MKVVIAGDFCPRDRVVGLIESEKYSTIFSEVKYITSQADYSIVNLEAPVVNSNAKPIEKLGPNLKCTHKAVEALKFAGFNSVTLANNHIYDYGEEGIYNTICSLNDLEIDYVGGGLNIGEASKILYYKKEDKTLAIINCCEHEFSIATENTGGANPLNTVKQYYAIIEARQKADYVLVIVHGGHEYFQLPSLRMVENYRFFIDAGADAVVNHHQHCFSGFETYKGKPIYYGIGNFCFDKLGKRNDIWNKGFLVEIKFNDNVIEHSIHNYVQCDAEAIVKMLPAFAYQSELEMLNSIISDYNLLKENVEKYYEKKIDNIGVVFSSVRNRYINALQRRGLFPKLLDKRQKKLLQNLILCESHRDKLEYFFKNK